MKRGTLRLMGAMTLVTAIILIITTIISYQHDPLKDLEQIHIEPVYRAEIYYDTTLPNKTNTHERFYIGTHGTENLDQGIITSVKEYDTNITYYQEGEGQRFFIN